MLVVLDTNILVSALLSPGGKPAQILISCLNDRHTMCVNAEIMREYENVLMRDKFRIEKHKVTEFMNEIRKKALFIDAPSLDMDFTDLSDKKFYEVAKACDATLITGNVRHFPMDSTVKSVQEVDLDG